MLRLPRRPRRFRAVLLPALVPLAFAACNTKRVTRIDPTSVTDLSGGWNDTDSRLVANATMEHIPVEAFVRDVERAFVGSGAVNVLASAAERGEVRAERADQQQNATADTRVRVAREQGAQYMLQGDVQAIEDAQGRERVVYYQVDATLLDIETHPCAPPGRGPAHRRGHPRRPATARAASTRHQCSSTARGFRS